MSIKETLSDKNKPQQDAIKALISPVNTAVESDGPEGVEKALWNTWNELIDVASKTPHSEQDHLVQIVRKTQRQAGPSKTDGSSCKVWDEEVEWDKMSLFGPALREKWNYTPNSPNSEAGDQWININAFVARLTAGYRPSEPFDFSLYGVWTIRAALEDEETTDASQIQAACVWLIYAGQVLLEKSQSEFQYDGKMAKEGSSLRGKEWRGCSDERWNYWQKKIEDLVAGSLDEKTKLLREQALAQMKKVKGDS